MILGACESSPPPDYVAPTGSFEPTSITVAVGETASIGVKASKGSVSLYPSGCGGVADVQQLAGLAVRGIAPGQCTASMTLDDGFRRVTGASTLTINVVAAGTDAGTDAAPDASDDAGAALCSATVGFINKEGDRDRYMAFSDVDSNAQEQACPIHTSTNFMGDIVFAFLAGSPGYTIDGRGNYEILTAVPSTALVNQGGSSYANALEDQTIAITFRRRVFNDEDAAVPPPTWAMSFRMVSNPDPAKWRVDLYSFSKTP